MPTTIRKALISEYGDVSKVSVVSATIDDPAADHVQVRVLYSSFTGADVNMRTGHYPLQRKAPLTPGYSFVGTVEKNGSDCTKFKTGDMVACLSVYDAESELANMPEKYLIPVPPTLDLQKVCAMICDWTTAYGMVMRTAKVVAGQKVFVHGMSGSVGYATSTLCQLQGAQVYGTASERNHEALKANGWTPFVYSDKDWMKAMLDMGGADVVFDPLGFESWDESYSILSHNDACLIGYGGNLVTLQGQPSKGLLFPTIKLLSRNFMCPVVHKHTRFFYITRDDKTFVPELQALFDLLDQGKIDVRIKAVFDLENIREAHETWGKSGSIGSMIIRVGDTKK